MFKLSLSLASLVALVAAESHTITFDNRCGFGTPTLVSNTGAILSTGGSYTANGPIIGAISGGLSGLLRNSFHHSSMLYAGGCGLNGDRCTIIETTLRNSLNGQPGSGSTLTSRSFLRSLAFSVTSGFGYYNGCDGTGADCTYGGCPTAFHKSDDTHVQVACQANDVNLVVTFCN
ncbi:hypothetical protein CPB85DRAFT_1326442 [Mucidula mucida]|nr:hypothetical protein CPB85DRAFT_1326442 [Mucidula mucida]